MSRTQVRTRVRVTIEYPNHPLGMEMAPVVIEGVQEDFHQEVTYEGGVPAPLALYVLKVEAPTIVGITPES